MNWVIKVVNKTGDEGHEGETVEFMIFQTVQEDPNENSYSAALVVNKVAFPGTIEQINVSEEVTFYVIETVSNSDETDAGAHAKEDDDNFNSHLLFPLKAIKYVGNWFGKVAGAVYDYVDSAPQQQQIVKTYTYEGPSDSMQYLRTTGPFRIKIGETATVSQKNPNGLPKVKSSSSGALPKDTFKIVNESGNVKPLEFALYKNEAKIFSHKDVLPNQERFFPPVQPALFIMKRLSHHTEYEFRTVDMMKQATRIELHPNQPHLTIGIYKKHNSEIEFKQTA